MVSVSLAEFEPSCPVTVIAFPGGGDKGAVYKPLFAPIDPGFPPLGTDTDHAVLTSVTPLSTEENCIVPPAGTVDTAGFIEKPRVTPIVTTAVFEVTVVELLLVPVVLVVVVVLVVALGCSATAVMFTWPLLVEGTIAGAV